MQLNIISNMHLITEHSGISVVFRGLKYDILPAHFSTKVWIIWLV